TLCSPATVVFSTRVPRGRTALIASCKPEGEPVASTTRSNCLGFQSFKSIVLTPDRLMSLSLSGCFPPKAPLARASLRTRRAQKTQFAIPQTQDLIAGIELYLLQNLKGSGEGFRKDGLFIANTCRHKMQIGDRHGDEFGESSVSSENSHDTSRWTVAAKPALAIVAPAAGEVDFADNALMDELLRSFNDRADKFVSRDTLEIHVAFKNL